MKRGRRPAILAAAAAAVTIGALGSCGDDEGGGGEGGLAEQVYVGRVADSDAFVAVVTSGNVASAFACDGEGEVWAAFPGIESDETLELRAGDGAELTGEVGDGEVTGTISLDGERLEFKAAPASGDAGLYLADGKTSGGESVRAGWVVLEDGEQRGASQAGTTISTVSPLNLASRRASVPGLGSVTTTRITPAPSQAFQFGQGQFGQFGGS